MATRHDPALPADLSAKLAKLGAELEDGPSNHDLEEVLRGLSALPAHSVVRANREIAAAMRLVWWKPPRRFSLTGLFRKPLSEADLLRLNPDYAWLFIFHADGHMREVALKAIQRPPLSPFFFAALAWRLNDWVREVRRAAAACAERVLLQADPDIAAVSARYLLDRRASWGRWSDERRVLDAVFSRPDVIARLADHIREAATGPFATTLRYASRFPTMDEHLPRLAVEAAQPAVRAAAYQCLISGKATWIEGYRWIWIDKVYGVRKSVPDLGFREISRTKPVGVLIAQAIRDRSSAVRRVAADGLIELRAQVPDARAMNDTLAKDRSAAVRSRADFIARHYLGA
jgi:hypothetical protein